MFDDRLEIYSPGGMADGSKVQDKDLMKVPSKRRNLVIADIFNRLKFMERRGSGFKKILEEYKMQPQFIVERLPEFLSESDSFFLILQSLNYEKGSEKGSEKEELQGRQEELLKILSKYPSITRQELMNETGLSQKKFKMT